MNGDGLGALRGCVSALAIMAGAAGAVTVVVVEVRQPPRELASGAPREADPHRLARCRRDGEAALGEPACSRAWRAAREAFLARR